MNASPVLIRFPLRRAADGWSFGSLDEAHHEANWLASNLSLSVREVLR